MTKIDLKESHKHVSKRQCCISLICLRLWKGKESRDPEGNFPTIGSSITSSFRCHELARCHHDQSQMGIPGLVVEPPWQIRERLWDHLGIPGWKVKNISTTNQFLSYLVLYSIWLVVWTPLKNISQLGWLFPIYGKIKNVPNHQPGIV